MKLLSAAGVLAALSFGKDVTTHEGQARMVGVGGPSCRCSSLLALRGAGLLVQPEQASSRPQTEDRFLDGLIISLNVLLLKRIMDKIFDI